MPTNDGKSKTEFQKHLDILHSLLAKYSPRGTVIIVGDMNGTLLTSRNNPHDISLKEFVSEHELTWCQKNMGSESTFVSHTGNGRSQIDYIFASARDILISTKVEEKHCLNQSAHTVVSSTLNVSIETSKCIKTKRIQSKSSVKLLWDKIDNESYQSCLSHELDSLRDDHCQDPEDQFKVVMDI